MGLGEGIRECVADVGVQTNDINSGAVTNDKLAGTCIKYASINIISATVSGYLSIYACSSNVTFLGGILQVTAVGTSGTITICNSGGTALIEAVNISAAAATYSSSSAAATARVLEITAGASLCALYNTATATSGFKAKLFVSFINTP